MVLPSDTPSGGTAGLLERLMWKHRVLLCRHLASCSVTRQPSAFKGIAKFEIKNRDDLEPMLMGWMRKITINVSLDYMKKESLISSHKILKENAWLQADNAHEGDNELMYKDLISLIRKLSPAYRVVFNLHVIDGYSHQEIARMLDISPGTSKSNLSKAKAFLQKFLVKDRKGNVLCFT